MARCGVRAAVVAIVLGLPACGDRATERNEDSVPVHFRSATSLAESVRNGEIRPSELLELYLGRLAELNGSLNAVVALDIDNARRRAVEADRALDRGELWGPLHGLPITIKDLFAVAGMPTTAGVPGFETFQTTDNAVAVQRLLDAGAIVFGKTNVPFLGSDWQSYNAIYGTTNNPWDLARTPGGSSGGAAAAVAAGLSAFELGSDIGGSIRVPAHFTGIYGHKPTFGLVPREGQFPMFAGLELAEDGLSVAGPLARSADDLELLLDVLMAPAGDDGEPVRLPPPRRGRLEDYRVAVWLSDPRIDTDREVLDVLEHLIGSLRETGAHLDETARPEFALAKNDRVYVSILLGIVNLPPRPAPPEAFVEQQDIRRAWARFFERYDVVLCPTSPTVALRHDHSEPAFQVRTIVINGSEHPYGDNGVWMGLATLAGLPATTAPAGISRSGLPVGVQIIGPRGEDRTTIDFARRLAALTGGFVPPPPTAQKP
jgi:amidase